MGTCSSRTQKNNHLIQRQQETIRKQQLIISKQLSDKPNQPQSKGGKAKMVNIAAIGPKSTVKRPGICFEYKCPLCVSIWRSNINEARKCKKCHINVYPSMVADVPTNNPKTHEIIRNNLNKFDATKKNMKKELYNNKNDRFWGEFKCDSCNLTWATTYYGSDQNCNRCKAKVLPFNVTKKSRKREDLCGDCKTLGYHCQWHKKV